MAARLILVQLVLVRVQVPLRRGPHKKAVSITWPRCVAA